MALSLLRLMVAAGTKPILHPVLPDTCRSVERLEAILTNTPFRTKAGICYLLRSSSVLG